MISLVVQLAECWPFFSTKINYGPSLILEGCDIWPQQNTFKCSKKQTKWMEIEWAMVETVWNYFILFHLVRGKGMTVQLLTVSCKLSGWQVAWWIERSLDWLKFYLKLRDLKLWIQSDRFSGWLCTCSAVGCAECIRLIRWICSAKRSIGYKNNI
jgi:hypothetical protein